MHTVNVIFFGKKMSTSDELRAALNRRLKKIDVVAAPVTAKSSVETVSPAVSETIPDETKQDQLSQQVYRSGWGVTPPIQRSVMLPPPLASRESPTKSEMGSGRVCFKFSKFCVFFSGLRTRSRGVWSTSVFGTLPHHEKEGS